jgi:AcrR family transcriptional regulator
MIDNIREPKQQRAIEKKEKIIESGFNLICENGYYNTNTAEIAKAAGVSTGIVYQYFKDKYDILIEGLEKYGDDIFFPMLKTKDIKFEKKDFEGLLKKMINHYISNHKVSNVAHEEIMSMVHSDKRVAEYYYKRELEMTNSLKGILLSNGFDDKDLSEKVHVMMGLIDNLCHEVTYHKHSDMNYDVMTNLVIDNIKTLFKNDLV